MSGLIINPYRFATAGGGGSVSTSKIRINITSNNSASYTRLAYVCILDDTGANLVGSGTASADGNFPGYPASNATTTSLLNANDWASADTTDGHWWEYDFGSSQTVGSVILQSPAENGDMPYDFDIQYWNGSSYVDIVSRSTETWTPFEAKWYIFGGGTSATNTSPLWRINSSANNSASYTRIGDLHFDESGTDRLASAFCMWASSYFSTTYYPWYGANNSTANSASWASADSSDPQFLAANLSSSYNIDGVDLTATDIPADTPYDFTIEYYDGSSWQVADTQTAQSFTSGETKTYSF